VSREAVADLGGGRGAGAAGSEEAIIFLNFRNSSKRVLSSRAGAGAGAGGGALS